MVARVHSSTGDAIAYLDALNYPNAAGSTVVMADDMAQNRQDALVYAQLPTSDEYEITIRNKNLTTDEFSLSLERVDGQHR